MDKNHYFSAPGRTELGGNHTDHQHGLVLAAAIDLEMTAQVRLNETNQIRVSSEGYAPFAVCLEDLACRDAEKGTGAFRVHGGGFAGTIPAYVPLDRLERFIAGMEAVLGKGCCKAVNIRNQGSIRIFPH